ncbi:hypothetical protein K458DRAFT_313607, partial [Lentithecium fluviatile CBS 122367]
NKLIVFFYVNDIITLCVPAYISALNKFKRKLLSKYEIRSLEELQTFCGIQVKRDRDSKLI